MQFFQPVLIVAGDQATGESKNVKSQEKWIHIFNGHNLDGWIPKITGYKTGINPLDLFHVEDGLLKVDYSKFNKFNGRFGHLFYKEKLSSYILHIEYRFVGELLPDAPGYCYRNSGVMIHSQSAESMDIVQNWPVSIESQFLGSTQRMKQKTASICTPGTTVSYKGMPTEEHCIESTSKYYYDNQWVSLDVIVKSGKTISNVIDGDTVLSISQPKIGGSLLTENFPLAAGTLLEDGYIALQAEGQNIDFRKVDLMILDDSVPKKGVRTFKGKRRNTKISETLPDPNIQNKTLILIDNFDSYKGNVELHSRWYHQETTSNLKLMLESFVKGYGKYSLKCEYLAEKDKGKNDNVLVQTGKWDLTGCNGIQFWFKPDGSGREFTIEFNIADKNGKNINDTWGYTYVPEKGDTGSRIIGIPFSNLKHNPVSASLPESGSTFNPASIIEVSLKIGGKNESRGRGTYYFDEIYGTKLQI